MNQTTQVVAKVFEFMASRQAAIVAVQAAKQAEDAVQLDSTLAAVEKEAASIRDVAIQLVAETYGKDLAKIRAPLQAAQGKFDVGAARLDQTRAERVAEAHKQYQMATEAAQQKQEARMATAHAAVSQAEAEAAIIQTSIDQYKRQVQESTGLDLNKPIL